MADLKISQLTGATTPLDGTEVLPIVQGGSTKQVSVANLTAGRDASVKALTATGLITPSEVIGIKGTGTNNSAQAGSIGEFVSSYVSSLVALTSGIAKDVTSISLTAGDWDITANIGFLPAGTTAITALAGSINTTSATYNDNAQYSFSDYYSSIVPGSSTTFYKPLPTLRLSLAATTTVYLVAKASFSIAALYHGGAFIRARRVR
jgi:hypothetical protein